MNTGKDIDTYANIYTKIIANTIISTNTNIATVISSSMILVFLLSY